MISVCCLELLSGTAKPFHQRCRIFRPPAPKPLDQRLDRRRQNEDEHRIGKRTNELLCSLYIDVYHHVLATLEDPLHLVSKRAVELAVNLRRFSELSLLSQCLELLTREKEIILPL